MGGPKRVILAVVLALLALAAILLIWFATLKPEVQQIILRDVFGLSSIGNEFGPLKCQVCRAGA